MKQLTEEWITKAEGDLKIADSEMRGPNPVADVVCFLCQQTVEKYLKARLTDQSVVFPRTHDLEALANLCLPTAPELGQSMNDLRYLTTFGVEERYPGTAAHTADAIRSVGTAHQIQGLIRRRLGI
ncbi:MAG: HEPN domain-containing protein [Chloroflexi bacterium]|nr:HEPN domain-containing protein [Chloroflexota bacterium]